MSSKFRVGGGYTAFTYNGQPLLFVEVISDTAPRPVVQPEVIQPLDAERPIEIAFPIAHGAGTLQLTLREEWDRDVWRRLPGLEGVDNIIDVFKRNVANGAITCAKIIKTPTGRTRGTLYHGAFITDIDESEQVNIASMTFPKRITMMYTHKTPISSK